MALTVVGWRMVIDALPNRNEQLTLEITNGEGEEALAADLPPGYADKLVAWLAVEE
jgi:hypothetical protein